MNPDRFEHGLWPHVIVLDPFTAGLAVARRMVRLGARVTVFLEPSDLWAARTRGVETVIAPFADGQLWLEHLRRLAANIGPAVVLPATDRSCELLVRCREMLPDNLLAFERSGHAHIALMDKEQADGIARSAGVAVPWTSRVSSLEDLHAVAAGAQWPCVVKPVFSHQWREHYGPARVFIAPDELEASRLLSRPLTDGIGMLLSQYIPGGDEDVEEAIVVRLADGSYPVSFGCRKLRQNPPGFGSTSLGEASPLPETMAIARRVLDRAGFVGVAGVETKRDAETGERWFLEVNVRIPGQWGLGDTCGVQATTRLVGALAGRAVGSQPPLRKGVRIVVPDADAPVIWQALIATAPKKRAAFVLRIALSYRRTRNFGLLDLRDPGPGLAFVVLLARRRLAGLTASARRLARRR
jgi:D-aspartate ligase